MTPQERLRRARDLFEQLVDESPADWTRRLAEACPEDPELRAEVLGLLRVSNDSAPDGGRSADSSRNPRPEIPTPSLSPDPDATRPSNTLESDATTTLNPPAPSEPTPERIGPYRVQRQIGRGGMGTVLLAIQEDGQFKRRVAVKLLRKGLDTADILRRFDLERQVLAALNHPNIARLLDAGQTDDGRPYFVMEYIEGQAIDDYCDRQNLSVDERLFLFRKVCGAVHYAHQNLIVHRDLKPGNIIVTSEGEPKLLDFGIAKLLNPDLMHVSVMTGPALRLMTPEYASPEQVRGEPIGITSDVYALGVLLYELLSGHRPYKLATRIEREIVRAICDTDPVPPSDAVGRTEDHVRRDGTTVQLTPETVARQRGGAPHKLRRRLAGDLDIIVLKAMQKVSRRRYSSAEQLSEDIQRHLDGMPIIARPDSQVYRWGKFIRRNRLAVSGAAALFLTLALGVAGTTWQWRVAVRERDRAETLRVEAVARAEHLTGVVRATIAELRGELRRTEGATGARRLLATTALQIAERLASESDGDPNLVRALAEMSILAGDALGGFRTGNQGEADEALASFGRALKLVEALATALPEDRGVQLLLVRARVRKADLLDRMNRPADALALYQAAASAAGALTSSAAEPDARPYLASALDGVGDQQFALRHRDAAEKTYNEARAVRNAVLVDRPGDIDAQRAMTVSSGKLAKLLEDGGRLDDALAERRATLVVRERIAQTEPSARARRDVMVSREKIGDLLRLLRRFDEADPELQAALNEAQALSAADPADKRAAKDVVRLKLTLAALRRDQGRFDESETVARTALAHGESLTGGAAQDAEAAYLVARCREAIARAIHGVAPARAVDAYHEALREYARIPAGAERNALIESQRVAVELALGLALADAGKSVEAAQRIEAALALAAALGPEEGLTYEVRLEVGRARERLAALRSGGN